MRKLVITTIILLIAVAAITVVYFKNLNPPGSNTSRVMNSIPDNASVIFQFSNEQSFYDIFSENTLLTSIIGQQKIAEIDTLRSQLLGNPLLYKYFNGQNLFISLHPLKNKDAELLLTTSASKGFDFLVMGQLAKQKNTGFIINPVHFNAKPGYSIYINSLKKRFYVINIQDNIFSGSFSQELAEQSAGYKPKSKPAFVMLSEQQNSNSLADLYVNYAALSPLFEVLFQNKYSDIFRSFKLLPAQAALSLNYKSDALMFSGITNTKTTAAISYLNIFADQQPVVNHLKDIFPSTTAYSTNFSVSNPLKFGAELSQWHIKAGIENEKDALFNKVKAETGMKLISAFDNLLGNEFAIVTTRYQEKLAIISVKNGSKMTPLMMNISNMVTDTRGQFNYDKLPFYLLGDAFSVFKRPYFMVIDNYLILANSLTELNSYTDSYINRKFLSKMDQYNQFDDLLSERSNVAFFINFKNAQAALKNDLEPAFYNAYEKNEPGWRDFYAASYQFSAADKNFYTNFCVRLNSVDTATVKIRTH